MKETGAKLGMWEEGECGPAKELEVIWFGPGQGDRVMGRQGRNVASRVRS